MARDIYPHDHVPTEFYVVAVKGYDTPEAAPGIEAGIAALDAAAQGKGFSSYLGTCWERDRVDLLRGMADPSPACHETLNHLADYHGEVVGQAGKPRITLTHRNRRPVMVDEAIEDFKWQAKNNPTFYTQAYNCVNGGRAKTFAKSGGGNSDLGRFCLMAIEYMEDSKETAPRGIFSRPKDLYTELLSSRGIEPSYENAESIMKAFVKASREPSVNTSNGTAEIPLVGARPLVMTPGLAWTSNFFDTPCDSNAPAKIKTADETRTSFPPELINNAMQCFGPVGSSTRNIGQCGKDGVAHKKNYCASR
jgi:hypothetical protein